MKKERLLELLAFAKVCFDKCSNPFAQNFLIENNVSPDECGDLSNMLGVIVEEYLTLGYPSVAVNELLEKAEEKFEELTKD